MKLNCASVYVIEPQKHEMLDFTLVPKLLGFFQWNYNRELVLLKVFFWGGEGRDGNRKSVLNWGRGWWQGFSLDLSN